MLINDAIHGVMTFDDGLMAHLRPIIDQPIFQRLRHIKQVGLVDLVFPSATHTRFNHSLGCAYLASRFAKALDLKKETQHLAVISALIHDIGHGPFSHAFERLLCNRNEQVRHEDWSYEFLADFDLPDTHPLKMHQETVKKFIKGEYSYSKGSDANLVADIVSSQLDADRLDYLLRDSHFCGVSFGEIDAHWILKKLVRIEGVENSPRLGIEFKGVNSVEHYLLARRLMTRGVYNHSLVLLYETLVIIFLEKIVDHLEIIEKLPQSILKDFLGDCHGFRKNILSKNDFIYRAYPNYRKLADYDVWSLIREIASDATGKWPRDLIDIALLLYTRRKMYKIVRLNQRHQDVDDKTARKVMKKYGLSNWQLIVLKGSVATYQGEKSPLYIKEQGREVSDLTKHSHIMHYLGGQEEQYRYLAIHNNLNTSEILQEFGLE
ncbi:MAG: HD domain-containing protein [Alphaproteobacteria bacterium]|nr:HD domain-containing protein [Alphaproteobacteria bacterium]NCQ66354.1 HD domain-containing protein [Alphaproteobacteria bacterium]NCT06840.1 HD domain-containing protein [Alphaproteobacteria bacterium]